MKTITHNADFCVVGGGLAGLCAAIAAARHGIKTVLMHDRPVLGGNASSEIRMWVCGAGKGYLETGLMEEIRLENLYRNNYPNYSVWDSILYEKARFQENLTLLLNCSCNKAEVDGCNIKEISGWQSTTQTFHIVQARLFADCSGDSILAPLTGAEYHMGREARHEFNESLAPETADENTMGMSCLIQVRETSSPQLFIPPAWAEKYITEESLKHREHNLNRFQNFWWLEIGGTKDCIHDTEELRDELLKIAFGVWDHIKNHGDHGAENWVLDWIGFLPGKRESRRYVGDYIMTQADIAEGSEFDDIVAYGGWGLDNHHPDGMNHNGPPNEHLPSKSPYGIPYRALYSHNIDNLFFAGRNISTTHLAMSSTRVMATCALMGQAIGTAAALAVKEKLSAREIYRKKLRELQHALQDDDCWLPGHCRMISGLSRSGVLCASNGNPAPLHSGIDRLIDDKVNHWEGENGDWVEYRFPVEMKVSTIRIVFDSDLHRPHLNMVAAYPLEMPHFAPPETLIKGFHIEVEDKYGEIQEIWRETNNYQRFVKLDNLNIISVRVRLCIDAIHGSGPKKIFAFDLI